MPGLFFLVHGPVVQGWYPSFHHQLALPEFRKSDSTIRPRGLITQ